VSQILTSNYLVAYIDLLGQSEKLKKYPLLPPNRDETFDTWQKETYGLVMSLRSTISKMLEVYNSDKLISKQLYKTNGIKIKPFSDSIIMYTSLYEEDSSYLPIIDVWSIINSIGSTLLTALSVGINFRVGIDIGLCNDDNIDGIYGSAISLAYKLESEIANYQRIVIGKQLYDYVFENASHGNTSSNYIINSTDYFRNLDARAILSILQPIGYGNYMVNILSEENRNVFTQIGKKEIANEAYDRINSFISTFDETKEDLKVLSKYLLLKRYFELNMQKWIEKNV
jgi:hypothetical protein